MTFCRRPARKLSKIGFVLKLFPSFFYLMTRQESANNAVAEEADYVKLYCQMPPIAKLDSSLGSLKNCELVIHCNLLLKLHEHTNTHTGAWLYQPTILIEWRLSQACQSWRFFHWVEIWSKRWGRRYFCHLWSKVWPDWKVGGCCEHSGRALGFLQPNKLPGWYFHVHQFDNVIHIEQSNQGLEWTWQAGEKLICFFIHHDCIAGRSRQFAWCAVCWKSDLRWHAERAGPHWSFKKASTGGKNWWWYGQAHRTRAGNRCHFGLIKGTEYR